MMIESASVGTALLPHNAPPSFHVLAKPTGAICNLDCKYCFFLSKEMLYPGSRFRMADDLLEQYIKQLIEGQRAQEIVVAWQGGEPTLMGLDFFKRSLAYEQKYLPPGKTILNTIQTNGTLLDEEWCAFFKANNFLVGLSLDGPRELHDAYRVDKGGAPTFDKVMRAAQLLQEYSVDFNILCTVHAANQNQPLEVYRFFRDEVKTQYIQFIPIIERATPELLPIANEGWGDAHHVRPLYVLDGSLVTDRSVTSEAWGDFLMAVFDEWVRHDVGDVFVQMFDAALASWVGLPSSLCIFAETCGNALALEHNGDLYSCDHFVEPKFKLGNIKQDLMIELVASERQRAFGNAKRDTLPKYCRECAVKFACHGECPRNRFIRTPPSAEYPNGEEGLNYLCAGYKAFFTHIDEPMRFMARELQLNRAPSNVRRYMAEKDASFARAFAQAGRNDPCPCGSGRKVKHCHGKTAQYHERSK